MLAKNFKFMENYNSEEMYFEVQVLTLDIFTHVLPPSSHPHSPVSPLQFQETMIWNIKLNYMICNFFKCDYFTVL